MNNIDSHPRVLSLSSTSTPLSSTPATPTTQSRRASHDSVHHQENNKTHKTQKQSIEKLWAKIKHHVAEHHRSVNAAYQAQYGATGVQMLRAREAEAEARFVHSS